MHEMLATDNTKKTVMIFCITIILLSSTVFASYNFPTKYKGLQGINKNNVKPKTSFKILAQPATLSKTLSKQGILKQKALSLLGSNNNKKMAILNVDGKKTTYSIPTTYQGLNGVLTKEKLLKGWHLERKYGKMDLQ